MPGWEAGFPGDWSGWLGRAAPGRGREGYTLAREGVHGRKRGAFTRAPEGGGQDRGEQVQPDQETANERRRQDFDTWGVRCLVSRPCPLHSPALGFGSRLRVVVASRVPSLWGTAGGLVWKAWSGRMQFPVTPKLSYLRLGLSVKQVLVEIGAPMDAGPLGGDSLRAVWPGPPFLNVRALPGLQGWGCFV